MDKKPELNEKINLLYNFAYSNYNKKNVKVNKIDIKNITLDDIKFKNRDSDYYHNLLSEILDGRFKFINYDDNITMLKKYSDNLSTSLYISPYKSRDNIENLDDPNNNDALFSYLLSPLVLSRKTKHILLPVINIDVDFQQVSDVLKNYTSYENYMNSMDNEEITNQFSLRLKENFFKSSDLHSYMESNRVNMKKVLFQLIHTLSVIQDNYKGFRHNKLEPKNIMIYFKKPTSKAILYEYKDSKYYLPKNDFEIKLNNFYYSTMPDYYNSLLDVPYKDKENRYFDIHYFINYVLHNFEDIDEETMEFFDRVVPHKYRNKTNNFYLEKDIEYITPEELLTDKYFNIYTTKQQLETNVSDNNYMFGKRKLSRKSKSQKGGGKIYNKPYNPVKNTPFITNEKRRIYNENKDKPKEEKEEQKDEYNQFNKYLKNDPFMTNENRRVINTYEKPRERKQEDNIIAKQIVRENPHYNKPRKPKKDTPHYVPKAKVYHENTRSDTRSDEYVPKAKPHYSDDKPYKTKYHKDVTEQPLIAEQKVYQPKSQPPAHTHPTYGPAWIDGSNQAMYPSGFVPEFNAFPNLLKPRELPLQKVYNINLGHPTQHDGLLNNIYEDVLPGDPHVYTYISINARKKLMTHIRGSILRNVDGEYMPLMDGERTSLSSYIRLLSFNPYNVQGNPYRHSPRNFMLYNAAYPIKFNNESNRIDIAKQSLGLNVRFYSVSYGAFKYTDINVDRHYFDMWREVDYYNYIKNEITMKNKSPNFVNMLFYKLDKTTKIDYTKLNTILDEHKIKISHALTKKDNKKIDELVKDLAQRLNINSLQLSSTQDPKTLPKLSADSGISLMAVTEAPTQNILEWSTPSYNKYDHYGTVKTMTSTGEHSHDVWMSVLFQLLHVMYMLESHQIYFESFSLENNIFIKDLFTNPTNIKHWEYEVNGVRYYVPNYGFLLMMDSRFVDKYGVNDDAYNNTSSLPNFKLNSPMIFNINNSIDMNKVKTDFYNIVNNELLQLSTLPDTIRQLLLNINNDNLSIVETMFKHFRELMHNKVGDIVSKNELPHLNMMEAPRFKHGDVLALQHRYGEYKWCVYNNKNGMKHNIITKDNNNTFINMDVFSSALVKNNGNLPQKNLKNKSYTLETLIEVYNK